MKVVWKVFSLYEDTVIKSAWLSSSGLSIEEESVVLRHFEDQFEEELDAIRFVETMIQDVLHVNFPEHGYEIRKVYVIA